MSPDHWNVPALAPLAGLADHDILSFMTVEFARGSTVAYSFEPSGTSWTSCPAVIWNCAAVLGSPRTASDAVPATSERRYLWKFGSSYVQGAYKQRRRGSVDTWMRTTARMKELPGVRVEVPLGELLVLVGEPPPGEVVGLPGWLDAAPGRHCA